MAEAKDNKNRGTDPQDKTNKQSGNARQMPSVKIRQAIEWADTHANFINAIATVLIAGLTLVLAYIAYKQTDVTMRALELNSRPYISHTFDIKTIIVTPGQKIRTSLLLKNSGKIPADTRTVSIITHSLKKLSAPDLPKIEDRQIIFPADQYHQGAISFIYSVYEITQGQFKDMMEGRGGCTLER